jgi:hypothetical protein
MQDETPPPLPQRSRHPALTESVREAGPATPGLAAGIRARHGAGGRRVRRRTVRLPVGLKVLGSPSPIGGRRLRPALEPARFPILIAADVAVVGTTAPPRVTASMTLRREDDGAPIRGVG